MSRIANWKGIINKFKYELLSWKANCLSIGSRLTLIKVVLGNVLSYYMRQKDDLGGMEKMFGKQRAWRLGYWEYICIEHISFIQMNLQVSVAAKISLG